MNDARQHHFQFAHVWLRGWFRRAPELAFARLTGDAAVNALAALWEDVGDDFGEADRLPPAGLSISRRQTEHGTCTDFFAIVELSAPQATGECHLVALVLRTSGARKHPGESTGEPVESWYFTLEYSDFARPRAMLCSWTEDRVRKNYGIELNVGADEFVAEIERRLPAPATQTATVRHESSSTRTA